MRILVEVPGSWQRVKWCCWMSSLMTLASTTRLLAQLLVAAYMAARSQSSKGGGKGGKGKGGGRGREVGEAGTMWEELGGGGREVGGVDSVAMAHARLYSFLVKPPLSFPSSDIQHQNRWCMFEDTHWWSGSLPEGQYEMLYLPTAGCPIALPSYLRMQHAWFWCGCIKRKEKKSCNSLRTSAHKQVHWISLTCCPRHQHWAFESCFENASKWINKQWFSLDASSNPTYA